MSLITLIDSDIRHVVKPIQSSHNFHDAVIRFDRDACSGGAYLASSKT